MVRRGLVLRDRRPLGLVARGGLATTPMAAVARPRMAPVPGEPLGYGGPPRGTLAHWGPFGAHSVRPSSRALCHLRGASPTLPSLAPDAHPRVRCLVQCMPARGGPAGLRVPRDTPRSRVHRRRCRTAPYVAPATRAVSTSSAGAPSCVRQTRSSTRTQAARSRPASWTRPPTDLAPMTPTWPCSFTKSSSTSSLSVATARRGQPWTVPVDSLSMPPDAGKQLSVPTRRATATLLW